jgi:cell wall-associated NlpC family hydrolase
MINGMDSREEQLRNLLLEVVRREERARKRAWAYVALPVFVGAVWLIFTFLAVSKLEKTKTRLTAETNKLTADVSDLKNQVDSAKGLISVAVPSKVQSFDNQRKQQILDSVQVDPNRRKALEIAFSLQEKSPPIHFKFGGKSPDEGFDTSGYIAYVLSQVGVLKNPETYYSGRLREKFARKEDYGKTDLSGLQAGDLIFYEPTTPLFYLDSKYCLGSVPDGIYIMDKETLGDKMTFITYAKVRY